MILSRFHLFLATWAGLVGYGFCHQCPEKYRHFSENHVMCRPPDGDCAETVDVRPQWELLDYHNSIRNGSRPFDLDFAVAADAPPMEWDEELFEMARRYASGCPNGPDCQNCFQSDKYPVTQNFANERLSSEEFFHPDNLTDRFKEVILRWAKEIVNYDKSIKDPFESSRNTTDNWINIFGWKTDRVGCACARFQSADGGYKEVYVCNYASSNYSLDTNSYKEGERKCSPCPPGYRCHSKYTRLCARKTEKANTMEKRTSEPATSIDFNLTSCVTENCMIDLCTRKEPNWKMMTSTNGSENVQVTLGSADSTVALLTMNSIVSGNSCLTFWYKVSPADPPVTLASIVLERSMSKRYSMTRVIVRDESWKKLSKFGHWDNQRNILAFHTDANLTQTVTLKDFVFKKGMCED